MKKVMCRLMGICFLAVSLATFAQSPGDTMKQDTMQKGNQIKHDNVTADTKEKKAISVSGKVSDDAKMFMSDKDNKNWMISNPGAVKGLEGHHVTVRAQIDSAKNAIQVSSIKMGKDEMKDTMKKDEMQH